MRIAVAVAGAGIASAAVLAQPEVISLGGGTPTSITNNLAGTRYIGGSGFGGTGAARWSFDGSSLVGANIGGNGGGLISADGAHHTLIIPNTNPQIFGNSATGVTPPFSTTPTLVPTAIATTEFRGARWSVAGPTTTDFGGLPIVPGLMVYGSSSSGGSTGNFISPNAISENGRFVVGLGYISTYNSAAGTTISANSFQWRAWLWDAQANAGAGAFTVLPTPFRTSTNTYRRRTANPYAVSSDGTVIVGAQEHNVSTTPTADPDGGRLVVWRWNTNTSSYEMSFLPNGVNGSGFPYTYSTTPGTVQMNAAGTIIVARAADTETNGSLFVGKWTWDADTSTWTGPVNLGSNLATPASWLPVAVTSCGIPPTLTPTGMSADGNVVVGSVVYSTCGSFMSGGFIWTSTSGVCTDWYDYLHAAGTPGLKDSFGPIGDNGDPNRGLPRLGFPTSISADGLAVVGIQGGTQLIPGATPTLVLLNGGAGCIAPSMSTQPPATANVSACTSSIILNANALGSRPITFQWYKDDVALVDGTTAGGSAVVGATSFQLRVNNPTLLDLGVYHCEITGPCGPAAVTTDCVVQIDPAFPAASNDLCTGAVAVGMGTNVLAPAQSPCAAYDNDPFSGASCVVGSTRTDRWFVFTPSVTQEYRLETCGANYDTTLSIFTNCTGGEVACNDNYNTGPTTGCTSTRSRIGRLLMTAGTPYYIRIAAPAAAFLSATSTMNLSISVAPAAAPGDLCSSPTPAVLGANAFDLTEASPDGIFVSCETGTLPSRDVWFAYTPVFRGRIRAATCPGTTLNTVLSIHDGPCSFELECNDNANVTGCTNQSVIDNFAMDAGHTYTIRVAGNTPTAVGAGTLTLQYHCDIDVNDDGVIDLTDLATLLANFGTQSGATHATGDIDGDGDVDLTDLAMLLSGFGSSCQ